MNRIASILILSCAFTLTAVAPSSAQDFKEIFNGKDLTDWEGKEGFWSVQDGAITGITTKEKPTRGNTFCIWKGKMEDFELKLKFRIKGHNSGIQFRSKHRGNFVVAGYQADFDHKNGWTGVLYEEKGRGMLARRGSKVVIHPDGKKETVGKTAEQKEILAKVKKFDEGWNEYHITAIGNHITMKLNGVVTVDLTDNQEKRRAMSGILAVQLHGGPPMTVQVKDVMLKQIEAKTDQ